MIKINHKEGVFLLRWIKGQWRDKAGHVWKMNKEGDFNSAEHGKALLNQWVTV